MIKKWLKFWKEYKKDPWALASIFFLLIILSLAVFAPLLVKSPEVFTKALMGTPVPPGIAHLLGTDEFGRDYLSRLIYGARISLMVGAVAVGISVLVGTFVGAVAGYFGGWTDSFIMRFVDMMLSFPTFFLILTIQVLLKPSIFNVMVVIGLTSWMGVARLVRSQVLVVKELPYVEAARVMGGGHLYILTNHVIPNSIGPVAVAATLGMGGAILTESVISFLGLGVQPPTPSWGNMLTNAQSYIFNNYWWLTLFPGLMIMLTVLSFNFIGERLKEYFDPRSGKAGS